MQGNFEERKATNEDKHKETVSVFKFWMLPHSEEIKSQ